MHEGEERDQRERDRNHPVLLPEEPPVERSQVGVGTEPERPVETVDAVKASRDAPGASARRGRLLEQAQRDLAKERGVRPGKRCEDDARIERRGAKACKRAARLGIEHAQLRGVVVVAPKCLLKVAGPQHAGVSLVGEDEVHDAGIAGACEELLSPEVLLVVAARGDERLSDEPAVEARLAFRGDGSPLEVVDRADAGVVPTDDDHAARLLRGV